ncbi:MAG: hypothetical protein AAFX53_04460 [Bacteroidota bacterium]
MAVNNALVLISLLIFSNNVLGQNVSKNDIVGSWKVKRIVQKPENPDFLPILDGFSKATFEFHESQNFRFSTTSESKLFTEVIGMVDNTKWKYEPTKQLIKIGAEEDGFSIMGIYVSKEEGYLQFHIDESGLKFEMTQKK